MLNRVKALVYLIVINLTMVSGATSAASVNSKLEEDNIRQFFSNYMKKYNHYLESKEFNEAPYLYNETIMVMSSTVDPYVIEADKFYQRTQVFLDNLQQKGVDKVAWKDINVQLVDKNLAVASNRAIRFRRDGSEYNQVGVTYMLKKRNNEWRITSFTVHDEAGVIQFP